MRQMCIGILICLILSLPPAVCEVEKIDFGTNVYWKALDFEDSNWTSEDYNDSWWEDAITKGGWIKPLNADWIWYPGSIETVKKTAYFRETLQVPGEIVNGVIHMSLAGSGGEITLYINNISRGKWKNPLIDSPATVDITSYLKPGKNIIAPKVEVTGSGSSPGLILDGVIRYNGTS